MTLRGALTADLPLKFTSLGLSVFLWFIAAGEEPASALVPVDVTVRPPAGRTVLHPVGPPRGSLWCPPYLEPELNRCAGPTRATAGGTR